MLGSHITPADVSVFDGIDRNPEACKVSQMMEVTASDEPLRRVRATQLQRDFNQAKRQNRSSLEQAAHW